MVNELFAGGMLVLLC